MIFSIFYIHPPISIQQEVKYYYYIKNFGDDDEKMKDDEAVELKR